MNNKIISIGLFLIVVVAACLLYVRYDSSGMSFTKKATASTLSQSIPTVPHLESATTSVSVASSTIAAAQGTAIQYEIVTSQAAQERGLGGRAVIPDNYAMLFVFAADGTPGFWMKDMLAPIDMIWVTSSGVISAINDSVPVSSYPGVFYPPYPIRYVLETRAGFARAQGWHVGTVLTLPAPY